MKVKHIKNQSNIENMRRMAKMSQSHHRYKRRVDRNNKERERIRHKNYQRVYDDYKKIMKRKGIGQTHKIKGETLRSYWPYFD